MIIESVLDAKLPKDFKDKWVTALRSGKYKQTDAVIHNSLTDSYCCLGVACRIAYPERDLREYSVITEGEFDLVPVVIQGQSIDNIVVRHLTSMNDTEKKTFAEIADWIEGNL